MVTPGLTGNLGRTRLRISSARTRLLTTGEDRLGSPPPEKIAARLIESSSKLPPNVNCRRSPREGRRDGQPDTQALPGHDRIRGVGSGLVLPFGERATGAGVPPPVRWVLPHGL